MISIDIRQPEKEIHILLEAIAANFRTLKPAMRIIGETVRTSIMRNFRAEGRPDAWRPSKRAASESGQTLSLTGRLRNSFTVEPDEDSVAVGTNVVYAITQHYGASKGEFGTVVAGVKSHVRHLASGKKVKVAAHARRVTIPFGNIPARPFLMVQEADWPEIRSALVDHLARRK